MPIVRLAEIPWQEQRSPSGKFHSFSRNISLALGGIRNVGTWGGGHPFDLQSRKLPRGARVCPFHAHLAQWEFFLVQRGQGTVRAGSESHAVAAGDVFIHPPGEAHELANTGPDELEVLIIADNPELDACHYPDSKKWGLRTPTFYFRPTEVDYFDGEDGTAPPPTGFPTVPVLSPAARIPFPQRKLSVESLAWDPWESPRKTFRGRAKELSIALGAKRNTPTGLGGHPFDVELDRFGPGEAGNPFHRHAAQWELYLILAGAATMRVNDATLTLSAGDVCLTPPGEAHQLRNASAHDDLDVLVVADNPLVDYWFYPDSNKWGLREPRMFFRPENVGYYDGEE